MNKIILFLIFKLLIINAQAIDIYADMVIINQKENISNYSGNVIFTNGNSTIKADYLSISKKDDFYKVIATSNAKSLVSYNKQEIVKASAKKVIYTSKLNVIELEGNANLIKNNNHFDGEIIKYNIKTDDISIIGDKDNRVKLKINL